MLELQKAIYQLLTSDVQLMSLVGGVYDYVPDDSDADYVTIGNADYQFLQGHDLQGFAVQQVINAYSESKGRKALHDIAERIIHVFDSNQLSVSGYEFGGSQLQSYSISQEKDGIYYKLEIIFRIAITKI